MPENYNAAVSNADALDFTGGGGAPAGKKQDAGEGQAFPDFT